MEPGVKTFADARRIYKGLHGVVLEGITAKQDIFHICCCRPDLDIKVMNTKSTVIIGSQ